MDIATGKPLDDELKWVKFSGAAWTPDSKGSSTAATRSRKKDAAFQSLNINMKLYYHRVGTPQIEDVLVYERPDHPDWGLSAECDRRRPLSDHLHRRRHRRAQPDRRTRI